MRQTAVRDDLAAAVERHRAGALADAETLYRRVLSADPDNVDALHLLGLVRSSRGDVRQAIDLLQAAVARAPHYDTAYRNLANVARTAGDCALARRSGQRALILLPASASALLGLSSTAQQSGVPGDHERPLRQAAQVDPANPAVWQDRAVMALATGDAVTAASDTRRAVVLLPAAAHLLRNLGLVLIQTGDWAEAWRSLSRAAALMPGSTDISIALATAAHRLGNRVDAEAVVHQAVARDPAAADAWATLARLRTIGDPAAAAGAWRRAVLLAPGHATAWKGLSASTVAGAQDRRCAVWSERGGMIEPATLVPATGRPEGTLLVLRALQGGAFWMGDERGFRTSTGNNFIDYVATDRLARISMFVDFADGVPDRSPSPTAVCCTIADPDASPVALDRASRLVRRLGLPVVNHPDRVAATRRDLLAMTVGPLPNVVFPNVVRIDASDRPAGPLSALAASRGLELPVLARLAGTHTGESLELCRTPAALDGFAGDTLEAPIVLTRFIDYADAEGVYRKMRVFVVDGTPYPVHWFCSPRWYVRGHEDARRLMRGRPELTAEMRRFLEDPAGAVGPAVWQDLHAIGQRLGLDFVGIDFSILPDGRTLVFEANPAMTHHFEFVKEMPFQQPALEAISAAIDRMVHARALGPSAMRRSSSPVIASR